MSPFGETAAGIARGYDSPPSCYGAVDLTADEYHADAIGDRPAFSSSIAKILLDQSPAHAAAAHPKLNSTHERVEEDKFAVGTVAHALLLEGLDVAERCEFDSWRTKAAQEARDEIKAAGRIPLLADQYDRVRAMVEAALGQLDARGYDLAVGEAEQTLVWEERGVLCKARLDWIAPDAAVTLNLKTTATGGPAWARRRPFEIGADVQAALYIRGVEAVHAVKPAYKWVVVETSPPYALAIFRPSAYCLNLANAKLDRALEIWAACLAAGEWPGYGTDEIEVAPPPWEEARFLESEAA